MYNGICTPCCVDDTRAYPLGDIHKSTVKEIWHSDKLNKLRDVHKQGRYPDIEICKKCYIPLSKSSGETPDQM